MQLGTLKHLAAVGLAVALGAPVTACAVRTYDSEPVGYAEVSAAPVDVEASPYVVYEGRPTYWYRDRWYYRDGGDWRAYRREPAGLYRQRSVVGRPAVVARPAGPPPVVARPAGPPPVIARPAAPPPAFARPSVQGRGRATVVAH